MKRYTPLLLLPIFLFCACSEEKPQKTPPSPPLPVETVTVAKQPLPIWVQYTATTKATSEQDVRARVAGRLEAVYFKDGDFVEKGTPLFKIEQTQYKASLDAALARKERDIASQALAKANVDRYTPLVEEGLAPRATLEEYQARYAELSAQILADDADIASARLQLSYTVVRAPIAGRTSARRVDVGNLVGQGEATLLTTIMQLDPIYAYFNPPETDVQRIFAMASKQKLDAYIDVPNGGTFPLKQVRLDGHVDFSDNTVNPLTSTITVRAIIDNPKKLVMPGTFVYVNVFVTDKIPLIMVPPQIVFEDQMGQYVYVDQNGTAVRRNVKSGFSTRFYTVVTDGLKGGEHVIINGLMKLRPDRKVTATDVTQTKGMMAVIRENDLLPGQE